MKEWHDTIRQHVNLWSNKLPRSRAWWPKYVYHFTDVQNAVGILEQGALLSRQSALAAGLMKVENASTAIITSTRSEYLNFARLYYRPRTPTQYRNEGIRPVTDRYQDAHCDVPIFFLFDSVEVLSRDDVVYSDANIAAGGTSISGDESFFSSLPFDDIFHDGPIYARTDDIRRRRMAEVLVPEKLELEGPLKLICCRTAPERQTLLHLLSNSTRERWQKVVRLATESMYQRQATFVTAVTAEGNRVIFDLNPASRCPGPFQLRFRFRSDPPSRSWLVEKTVTFDSPRWSVGLRDVEGLSGVATLELDGALAFSGRLDFNSVLF